MTSSLLTRLRAPTAPVGGVLADEWALADIRFVANEPVIEQQHARAVGELFDCIRAKGDVPLILHEGGVYDGCWMESTGSINTELLARFLPHVAADTYAAFARHQRADGLFPYKVTPDGPAYLQIQMVTPFARCVWNHYCLNGKDGAWLADMYQAMARNDEWLAANRDTRNTGGVEAFCTFDTGHDQSSRFWHIPDAPYANDPAQCHANNPLLPLIAPDLTANVACQRAYMALIAEALGEDAAPWRAKAAASRAALYAQCYDEEDGFFYDRDRHERLCKVQSDVLLRVLACEMVDDAFFDATLARYLLNTRKFFARYPFTSIALDDPRFDHTFGQNSWSGPTNFLTIIRAAHAFEHHGRHVEMTWVMQPILSALFKAKEFAQTISPHTGEAGYTSVYAPTILCLLDFIERLCGILPRPEGTLWFTGLVPVPVEHRDATRQTGYGRSVDDHRFEMINETGTCTVLRDGAPLFSLPLGVRVITDRSGAVEALVGMSVSTVAGIFETGGAALPFTIGPNEVLKLQGGAWVQTRKPGYVPPNHD
ncbi:MAG: hypothetical protein JKX69_07510 [Rhodobacteraceae bacterium]|nr:hypothetical protein [Paracoccaceae bacterium]